MTDKRFVIWLPVQLILKTLQPEKVFSYMWNFVTDFYSPLLVTVWLDLWLCFIGVVIFALQVWRAQRMLGITGTWCLFTVFLVPSSDSYLWNQKPDLKSVGFWDYFYIFFSCILLKYNGIKACIRRLKRKSEWLNVWHFLGCNGACVW